MKSIKEILVTRDGLSEVEAEDLILDAKEALQNYLQDGEMNYAEEVCMEFFGLEPDYIDELL